MAGASATASRHAGHFAVQHPQGVAGFAAAAIAAQALVDRVQQGQQGLPEAGAALGAAQGVEVRLCRVTPRRWNNSVQHVDHLGVDVGAGDAEGFGVDLVKLTVAPFLGRSRRNMGRWCRACAPGRRRTSCAECRPARWRRWLRAAG
jgi:hypothetical protein